MGVAEMRRGGLELEERREADRVSVALCGGLDIDSASHLQRAIARLFAAGRIRKLTLDLSRLEFVDSTGLAAIVYASKLCDRGGCELSVIRGPDTVQQVFALTGLLEQLPFRGAAEADAPA
jgi:anti-sigma B factor antagonist